MANAGDSSASAQAPKLINSATAPSTALAVALVIFGSIGADEMSVQILHRPPGSLYLNAIIGLSLLLSFFITFTAAQLRVYWRIMLWPVNFCVLVALSFAGNNLYQNMRVPSPTSAPVIHEQVISGHIP